MKAERPVGMHRFVVVLRGWAGVRFEFAERMMVRGFPGVAGHTVNVFFATRYVDEGLQARLPRELWADVRGPASSVDEATVAFGNIARTLAPFIGLCANAPVGELEVDLAYDDTPGLHEREYFHNFVPDERGLPRPKRRVPVEATLGFLEKVATHNEAGRLYRATTQYNLALRQWIPGNEMLSFAHLFMGMEALTVVAVREHCLRKRVDEVGLARSMGVELGDTPTSQGQYEFLSAVRRQILFQGDSDCYKKAKDASDGLEHGYAEFKEVHSLASHVRDKTARYLREALIDLAHTNDETREVLLSKPYAVPFETMVLKHIGGTLISPTDNLAAPGNEYPILGWVTNLKDAFVDEKGELHITYDESFTASLGPGVEFKPKSYVVWRPGTREEKLSE